MLEVNMYAYHVLVLLAQPFAIELSTFHPQEMACNNCLGKHIHSLSSSFCTSFLTLSKLGIRTLGWSPSFNLQQSQCQDPINLHSQYLHQNLCCDPDGKCSCDLQSKPSSCSVNAAKCASSSHALLRMLVIASSSYSSQATDVKW